MGELRQRRAERIAGRARQAGFSLGDLGGLLASLFELFAGCGLSSAEVRAKALSPGRLDRLRLRRLSRRHGIDDTEAVEAALLDEAEEMTDQEIEELLQEGD